MKNKSFSNSSYNLSNNSSYNSQNNTSDNSQDTSSCNSQDNTSDNLSNTTLDDSSDNSSFAANKTHGNEFLGEVIKNNKNKYLIINKLGYGSFSSVWLAYLLNTKELVAMKIYHPQEYKNSINEINIFNKINNSNINKKYILTALDIFEIEPIIDNNEYYNNEYYNNDSEEKINNHKIIVLPLMALSVYDLLNNYENGLDYNILLIIIKQLILSLIEIDKINIIHTDLKPENILICGRTHKMKYIEDYINTLNLDINTDNDTLNSKLKLIINIIEEYEQNENNENYNSNLLIDKYIEDINIKLCDFNLSIEFNEENIKNNNIQTRYYRSPEIIMGYDISRKTDYWSIPCIIFELLTGGEILFDPEKTDECSTDIIHLNLIIEFFNNLPLDLIKNAPYYKKLFKDDKLINIDSKFICSIDDYLNNNDYEFLEKNHKYYKILNIMNDMFIIDPKKRKNLWEILNKYY